MDSNSQISTRWLTFGTTPDELADLLLIPEEAVDILFSQFDRGGSTCPSYASSAFSVAEIDFPPPSGVIQQLKDGKGHAFVFHEISLRTIFAKTTVVRSQACTNGRSRMFTCVPNESEF
jgi:hypothetical protein